MSAALLLSAPALAQDAGGIAVTAGVRSWMASWTTFTYTGANFDIVTPVPADRRLVLLPSVAARWGDVTASFSGLASAKFDAGTRREYDLALGWSVLPGLVVSAGYKNVLQRYGNVRYQPKGAFLGFAGDAAVSGPLSLYGQVALGRLSTSGPATVTNVSFKTDYRVSEVGLAYTFVGGAWVKRWRLTGGFRVQQMLSREAGVSVDGKVQDGVDSTDGFTLGVSATF